MALQFGPQVLLLPLTGFAADHLDRRKLLFATQAAMGALALGLGILTHHRPGAALWHVYVFAFLLGCVTAFDAPARQTFVSELVGEADLSNAVALNSTSFNAARMIGPAIAGVLIAGVGTGWVFLINAASFVAVLGSLGLLRARRAASARAGAPGRAAASPRASATSGRRPDLKAVLLMLFLIGTFGLNFPIFISTMSVSVFHKGAGQYGLSDVDRWRSARSTGALLSARRGEAAASALLLGGAAIFGVGLGAGGADAQLRAVRRRAGRRRRLAAQTFTTTANGAVQLSTEPAMRGRVMAILLAIALGGTPIGAPIVGWVADAGPRWALGVGAVAGFAAAIVGLVYLRKYGRHGRQGPAGSLPEAVPRR